MRCARCGTEMDDGWHFCPACGARKGGDPVEDFGRDLFSQMFGKVRDSGGMEKLFDKDVEALDLSPWFREIGKGAKGGRPFVPGMIKVRISKVGPAGARRPAAPAAGVPVRRPRSAAGRMPLPGVTVEPEADVRRIGDKVLVRISLPGVENEDSIDIKELESSVEVRALAGDRAYFKILTRPPQFRLSGSSFSGGELSLEFS